ncbi:MAG TPA: hypothetical protein PK927_07765, partial [Smithellaceae bacterium]|nr:hypothetical protein [Smithellaceae bacterium]
MPEVGSIQNLSKGIWKKPSCAFCLHQRFIRKYIFFGGFCTGICFVDSTAAASRWEGPREPEAAGVYEDKPVRSAVA